MIGRRSFASEFGKAHRFSGANWLLVSGRVFLYQPKTMRRNHEKIPQILPYMFFHQVWYPPPQKWIPFFEDPYALENTTHPKTEWTQFSCLVRAPSQFSLRKASGCFSDENGCHWWRGRVSSKYMLHFFGREKSILKCVRLWKYLPGN